MSNLINNPILVLLNIISVGIAVWVYSANKKEKVNQLFFLIILCAIVWTNLNYAGDIVTQPQLSLLLKRTYFALVSLFFIFAYFFSVYFPIAVKKRFFLFEKTAIFALASVSFLTIFTNFVVQDVEKKKWGFEIIPGSGIIIFYSLVVLFIFLILFNLIKKYLNLPIKDKLKLQYFLIGSIFYALFQSIFNIFFPIALQTKQYWQFGDYSLVFLLGFTAYAIVKRELFGIKVVLTSLLIGAIGIVLALQILIAPNTLWRIIDTIIFLLFCLFGYYLLRAVQQEEKRREEAEMLAIREMAFRQKAEKLAAEFKRLDEAKTQFMLATQHHLRTPLTSIQGYLSMLLEGSYGKISDRAKPKIKNALVATQRLIRLANEFLDVAQFEVGKETMAKREVQIEEVFDEVVDELRQTAKEKKLYVKLERPEQSLPSIMVDREKIKEAIYNVVFNGIKYTERGGVTVKLEIVNGKLQIVITDTGIGMEPEEIAGLFAKTFERGEQAKKLYTTGRGIGLYLAYQIIKAHGGRLWAESEGRGKGSTFYIELPIN